MINTSNPGAPPDVLVNSTKTRGTSRDGSPRDSLPQALTLVEPFSDEQSFSSSEEMDHLGMNLELGNLISTAVT